MISFSQEVKNELCTIKLSNEVNIKSEISAILLMSSELKMIDSKKIIKVSLTNIKVARRLYELIKKLLPNIEISIEHQTSNLKNNSYNINITNNNSEIEKYFDIDFFFVDEFPKYINSDTTKLCFIRGVFLARGSISDPQKGYNINISAYDSEFCDQFMMLCYDFDLNFKKVSRKRSYTIYLKGATKIGEFLRYVGSVEKMFEFENIRILRDAQNYSTRTANFDNANIAKTLKSSQTVIEKIRSLENTSILDNLTKKENEYIKIRLTYPEYSLLQLCEELQKKNIKASKSTLSTFFKKIVNM